MTYATLGKIEFQLLTGPHSSDATYKAEYAEQTLIGRKSSLQHTGFAPVDKSLGILFNRAWCDPAIELQALLDLQDSTEPVAYVLGNGDYRGTFVVTEVSESLRQTADDGTLITVECGIKLLEYIGDPAKPNPPGVLKGQPPLPANQPALVPEIDNPAGLLSMVSQTIETIQKVGEASARVNDIVAAASNGDLLGAVGLAGNYAPQLTELASQLPVDELQDLEGLKQTLIDGGQAATAISQAKNGMTQASTLLQDASTLSGLSSAAGHMTQAVSSSADALPALQRLEASAQVGSRLQGLLQ